MVKEWLTCQEFTRIQFPACSLLPSNSLLLWELLIKTNLVWVLIPILWALSCPNSPSWSLALLSLLICSFPASCHGWDQTDDIWECELALHIHTASPLYCSRAAYKEGSSIFLRDAWIKRVFPCLARKQEDAGMLGAASLAPAFPPRPCGCSSAPLCERERGGEAPALFPFKQRFGCGSESRIRGRV